MGLKVWCKEAADKKKNKRDGRKGLEETETIGDPQEHFLSAILALYLTKKLHFNEDDATVIYHTFTLFCYFTPILGAMLADQLLGKFRTIMYISLLYILGHVLKSVAAIPSLGIPPVEFSLVGLALIALGTGGISPCVSAFGGDQFQLPEQERQLQTFFSIFYFSINLGALLSTFITPILREEPCFGETTCYSLAFGIPALLMFVATLILFVGKRLYVMKPPQGNIFSQAAGSIWCALKSNLLLRRKDEHGGHWMDRALQSYPSDLVEDVKLLLKVLFIYLPLPIFWALYDQQGTRWTFQATRMDGSIGSGATILPDQMQIFNPILILVLIPIFDKIIYPLCAKCNVLVKPLQRMTFGGCLIAVSFLISGFLELRLMQTYDHIPKQNESHLHLMNSLPCPVNLNLSNGNSVSSSVVVGVGGNSLFYDLSPGTYDLDLRIEEEEEGCKIDKRRFKVETVDSKVSGVMILSDPNGAVQVMELEAFEEPKKLGSGDSNIRVVFDVSGRSSEINHSLSLRPDGKVEGEIVLLAEEKEGEALVLSNYTDVPPAHYKVYSGEQQVGEVNVGQGGVRTLLLHALTPPSQNGSGESNHTLTSFTLTSENSVHMLWLLPQIIVITVGEILFSVSGLEFSYSQAPESMKSVLQAAWLWTIAFGNLIVIIVAEVKAIENQAYEFFMFSGLLFADLVIFAWMAYNFTYVDVAKLERERRERKAGVEESKKRQEDGSSIATNETDL